MMDDLISRQAAIDALEITDWYHQDKDLKMVHGANSAEHQDFYLDFVKEVKNDGQNR